MNKEDIQIQFLKLFGDPLSELMNKMEGEDKPFTIDIKWGGINFFFTGMIDDERR